MKDSDAKKIMTLLRALFAGRFPEDAANAWAKEIEPYAYVDGEDGARAHAKNATHPSLAGLVQAIESARRQRISRNPPALQLVLGASTEWTRKSAAAARCVALMHKVTIRSKGEQHMIDDTTDAATAAWQELMVLDLDTIDARARELRREIARWGAGQGGNVGLDAAGRWDLSHRRPEYRSVLRRSKRTPQLVFRFRLMSRRRIRCDQLRLRFAGA